MWFSIINTIFKNYDVEDAEIEILSRNQLATQMGPHGSRTMVMYPQFRFCF
jgi:hypothetical protein